MSPNPNDHADNNGYRSESFLRRALFEETGGMYPELVTRPDIKVFLPPIGGMTVYICTLSLPYSQSFPLEVRLLLCSRPGFISIG